MTAADDDLVARTPSVAGTLRWRQLNGDTCPRCWPHAWHGVTCTAARCDCPTSFQAPPDQ